ncbi:MAG: 4-hydroxyphenylacetate 3-monooxygenase [Thermoleophilaceae bacterium]|nr:4-hydroxyphenylacetate 3-monooxygenase [Thermoleophilaceae bacterium]
MSTTTTDPQVTAKTGEQYLDSLRDGRVVQHAGERIEDVTAHELTRAGAATLADLYQDQHRDGTRELLTYVRDDGKRVTGSYMLTRTREEQAHRREIIEHYSRRTFGVFGRGLDMISMLHLGLVAHHPTFVEDCPEFADNILRYRDYAEENNIHLAEVIADPQGYRGRVNGTPFDATPPERATLRVVKQDSEGIWISGCKVVGTASVYAHEVMIGTIHAKVDDESFWCVVPMNAPGVTIFLREHTHLPNTNRRDHPIDAQGDEFEALLAFEEVFVPNERIMSLRLTKHHGVNIYNDWARLEHWYTFVRVTVKAELYAGLAQLIVDTLELGGVSAVRQRVSQVFEYAAILRSLVIAAEEQAKESPYGLLEPDMATVSVGRTYALSHLPEIHHILQDICGQGLMLRFSPADLETKAAFGQKLSWFLDTKATSAEDKNLVMNLVWDATCSAGASRMQLFEQQNGLPVPFLRERVYSEYDRDQAVSDCRNFIGLPDVERVPYAPILSQALGGRGKA